MTASNARPTNCPALVGGFGPEWVGVSVTMPNKFAALRFADERTSRAELVGAANTLVRTASGWRADNTDVDGVTGALGEASGHAIVVGSGGTAPAVVVGLVELGVQRITVVARNREKVAAVVDLASRMGVEVVGATSTGRMCRTWLRRGCSWSTRSRPTPLHSTPRCCRRHRCCSMRSTTSGRRRSPRPSRPTGGRVISGLQMLLHQAFAQVEQFTGMPAPKEAMRAALLGG